MRRFIAKDSGEPLEVLGGYAIDATGGIIRGKIDVNQPGDYGADPLGDGRFRMVPSGDIVDPDEKERRLGRKS